MKDNGGSYKEEQAQRIAYLVAGFIRQTLSEKERDELDDWITASDANQQLFEELINPSVIESGLKTMNAVDTDTALQRIRQRIGFTASQEKKRKPFQLVLRIAASVVLTACVYLIYTLMNHQPKTEQDPVQASSIRPGGNYATLTLGNGKRINLQDMRNGLVDSGRGSEVLKTADDLLSYVDNKVVNDEQHLLSTPVGGQYSVVLPDGSRVWLNAASSLKYPVSFQGNERVVELTGEGYFEISTSPQPSPKGEGVRKKPFIVKVNGLKVEVLGTHFNINAYGDDIFTRTTLLEGSVKVSTKYDVSGTIIKPGEQAQADSKGSITVQHTIDTEETVAWKNGLFVFKDASIETVLQQAVRWYDITVVYKTTIHKHFNAEVLRSEPIEKLLRLLELTGAVHFKIENKTIYVLP